MAHAHEDAYAKRMKDDDIDMDTEWDLINHLDAAICLGTPETGTAKLLRRRHTANYVQLQRQRDSAGSSLDEQLLARRRKLREKNRHRWSGAPVATLDRIQEEITASSASQPHTNSQEQADEVTSASEEVPEPLSFSFFPFNFLTAKEPPSEPLPSSSSTSTAKPTHPLAGIATEVTAHSIQASKQNEPYEHVRMSEEPARSRPAQDENAVASNPTSLASLLRKKTPRTDSDDEEMPVHKAPRRSMNPTPAHDRNDRGQGNPFRTAGQQLQTDRRNGRYEDEKDEPKKSNRRNSMGQPKRGVYHPVNANVLLGPSHSDDDDPTDAYNLDTSAVSRKFVSPVGGSKSTKSSSRSKTKEDTDPSAEDVDPRLKSCDPELVSKIEMEIVDNSDPVSFDDIAGLSFAKKCVNELVIWPMARPDIFTGLRALPKGLLLFGPPGTGKTLIGKAIANQSGATFFSISASSLTSKWIGEGEKLVRTLFAVASVKQPSVIFIDEIDSLLTQRSSEDNEASRRIKTEFLVQLDGAGTKASDVVLVVGATNRPQELDEAARRRFVKRLYIPLPSLEPRLELTARLLKNNKHNLSEDDIKSIADKTKGYSGADVRSLCTEAAMGPIRSVTDIRTMDADSVRPIELPDFHSALRSVRPSVSSKDLALYRDWNDEFGSFAFESHED